MQSHLNMTATKGGGFKDDNKIETFLKYDKEN